MSTTSENESWVVTAGDTALQRQAALGEDGLSDHERLLILLWTADYGMRNAGALETAADLRRDFQEEAAALAAKLGLTYMKDSFSLPASVLEQEYFERFERICDELKNDWPVVLREQYARTEERDEFDDLLDKMIDERKER